MGAVGVSHALETNVASEWFCFDELLVRVEMEYKLVPPTRHFDADVK